jgi:hypothetical protein
VSIVATVQFYRTIKSVVADTIQIFVPAVPEFASLVFIVLTVVQASSTLYRLEL